jgi:hypothetical protein
LRELGAKHIQYFLDADHNAEVDRYANEALRIEFIRHRDENTSGFVPSIVPTISSLYHT